MPKPRKLGGRADGKHGAAATKSTSEARRQDLRGTAWENKWRVLEADLHDSISAQPSSALPSFPSSVTSTFSPSDRPSNQKAHASPTRGKRTENPFASHSLSSADAQNSRKELEQPESGQALRGTPRSDWAPLQRQGTGRSENSAGSSASSTDGLLFHKINHHSDSRDAAWTSPGADVIGKATHDCQSIPSDLHHTQPTPRRGDAAGVRGQNHSAPSCINEESDHKTGTSSSASVLSEASEASEASDALGHKPHVGTVHTWPPSAEGRLSVKKQRLAAKKQAEADALIDSTQQDAQPHHDGGLNRNESDFMFGGLSLTLDTGQMDDGLNLDTPEPTPSQGGVLRKTPLAVDVAPTPDLSPSQDGVFDDWGQSAGLASSKSKAIDTLRHELNGTLNSTDTDKTKATALQIVLGMRSVWRLWCLLVFLSLVELARSADYRSYTAG
eukprot:TRINITY_DN24962_c0_g2_i1.p1 TRINITY_DN24962_c0_g2~~TRINITY_DN24962_c0_g2_i1.p1  ORF type:complete len:443 (+),score=48.86 TRINITY_DN24962_c0_g2_i1:111-1439(+)